MPFPLQDMNKELQLHNNSSRFSYPGLCQSQTVWSLRKARPRQSCCRCWQKLCLRWASHWRTELCWCPVWRHLTPGRTLLRWPFSGHCPPHWAREENTVCEHFVSCGKCGVILSQHYPLLNLERIMMGPNDSSTAMYMWSCTSVNTVGSKKKPVGRHITRQHIINRHEIMHRLSYHRWTT